ncbi:patatin-like phospholipase family protein [Azospirillum soli]|uniref:patatin-like phospholipase family protein n=1 Tax=Azospirillum soli TaxID=1304799 RepID=UPI001AE1E5B0|nr:patatin-like phospholipase family protein [Azospirillum soli]MBP2312251.1 NTE family protein [Azospirillum soli]
MRDLSLILSGGNALGAYQAGAYAVLHERGYRPAWISGASVGAVNAAIIAGNPPDRRVAQLRRFWEEASHRAADWSSPPFGVARRFHTQLSALQSRLFGSPGVFRLRFPGAFSALPGMPDDASLYDLGPLRARLEGVIDFAFLATSPTRLTVTAVDLETGGEVRFDTRRDRLRPEHLIASCGFLPDFPPVEVDGRLLCDGGMSANLPLSAVMEEVMEEAGGDRLCIAVDLFSRFSPRPRTVAQAAERQLSLLLANQTRKTIDTLQELYALRQRLRALEGKAGPGATTLLHLSHRPAPHEMPLKSFDYSGSTLAERWKAGESDMAAALDRLAAHRPPGDGLSVLEVHGVEERDERPSPECPFAKRPSSARNEAA